MKTIMTFKSLETKYKNFNNKLMKNKFNEYGEYIKYYRKDKWKAKLEWKLDEF